MRKLLLILGLSCAACGSAFCQSSFDLSSPEVREMESLYALCGRVFPTVSFPIFREDLYRLAVGINGIATSEQVQKRIQTAVARYAPRKSADVSMQLDGTGQQFIGPAPHSLSFEDEYLAEDPLLKARLAYQVDNSLLLSIENVTEKQYRLGIDGNNIPPSLPGDPFASENNTIWEGYFRYINSPIDVVFGRQPVQLGPAEDGAISASSRLPFLDALKVRFTSGPLTMTMLISTLENRRVEDQAGAADPPLLPSPTGTYAYGDSIIFYNIHYFEWDFGSVKAGLGAQYLISRPNNAFQLADFFPVFSWHQANIYPNNMCLLGDIAWVPLSGLSLYLQYGFDDINLTVSETSNVPTVDAEIVGARYAFAPFSSGQLTMDLGGGHTHYLWGNYNAFAYLSRAIYRIDLWREVDFVQSMPLTSPYGPGTYWATLDAHLDSFHRASAALSFTYALLNPLANLQTTPYVGSAAIANAQLVPRIYGSFRAGYDFTGWFTATASTEVEWAQAQTVASVALEGIVRLSAQAAPLASERHSQE